MTDQFVFTDASFSRRDGRAGVGAVYCDADFPPKPTLLARVQERDINCAELFAILLGVLFSDSPKHLTVYTDSKVAHDLLTGKTSCKKRPRYYQLVSCILYLMRRRRAPTWFVKVKAHAGNAPHDHADRLARAARCGRARGLWHMRCVGSPLTTLSTFLKVNGIHAGTTVLSAPG